MTDSADLPAQDACALFSTGQPFTKVWGRKATGLRNEHSMTAGSPEQLDGPEDWHSQSQASVGTLYL